VEKLAQSAVELSVVMPCLNEADTLASCIEKAQKAFEDCGVTGEIIVADNGSEDGCPEIAESLGARVLHVASRGYGNALMSGIAAARGRFILMGDADDSYDFLEIPKFVAGLREGADLVQGCRLPSGGGRIMQGAMPPLHRHLGNPLLSAIARLMFKVPIADVYCGMRGFTRELYDDLDQRCTGMEFATEMIIRASMRGAHIAEVPITLHPDGRRSHGPHLRTFRDGWRTLRFFLLYSPRWLFLIPGLLFILFGLIGYGLALPGLSLLGARIGAHTLLVSSLALMMGFQFILFAIVSRAIAETTGLLPEDPRLESFFSLATLERGILLGACGFVAGGLLILLAALQWQENGFGDLDYEIGMRWVIPGVTGVALGIQTILSSFFVSMLGMNKR
jgi:glycosyltransferase involved in cell wall biosynthesis